MPSKTIFVPCEEYPYASQTEVLKPGMEVLEISTRSKVPFGKSLSPFNLVITLKSGKRVKVECTYQGSKVLADSKQYIGLYWRSPRDAALDKRIKGQRPVGFRFFGKEYTTTPKHAFFDFLYIVGLCQRKDDVFGKLDTWDGFSDMFYSPRKDPNCRFNPKLVRLEAESLCA
ncbi:hypothetical protein C6499_14210 [Candidatus Poribacteria bacterium]|nr:MAG: hypothetical protein C6499_14210 [Candidatus Poribacteria bacterium]